MLEGLFVMGGIGFVSALVLGYASKIFYVEEDPLVEEIEEALPGANCGGCGFAGCHATAVAIAAKKVSPNVCVAGGPEVAEKIAAIMGIEVVIQEPEVAVSDCRGGERAEESFLYDGMLDCRAASMLFNGFKVCEHGCLGLGSCAAACPFDAIEMGPDRLPRFDPDLCRGCGTCVKVCPKGIISLFSSTTKILRFNRETDCLAPCRQKCPAQIDIPAYIEHIKKGRYREAILTIKERNPLPLSCGRVCPHPCEDVCRRGVVDEPVSINQLKRFAADYEMNLGTHLEVPIAPSTGYRVAVVGGGPAGLSCSYYLARLGHSVTIFDKMPKLGGMLRYGIPEYRLPKKILDWEIEGITRLGIEVKTNISFGEDITIDSLKKDGFDAIFLGVGAWTGRKMNIPGEDLEGVWDGIKFLAEYHLSGPPKVGRNVVVIGGGNTAIDAARTALRLGSKVTLMYRRSRAEMPANEVEIVAAEEEGIEMLFLAAPSRIIGQGGKAAQLEYIRMQLGEPDPSGRRRPEPIPGSETMIDADTVIAAIGQTPAIEGVVKGVGGDDLGVTRWKTIEGNEDTLETGIPGVFTAGDCFTGPSIAVDAIGGGRLAARSIHYYLTEGSIPPIEDRQRNLIELTQFDQVEGVEKSPRIHTPELKVEERINNFDEVEHTIYEEDAARESQRCLRCGLLCYDRTVKKD